METGTQTLQNEEVIVVSEEAISEFIGFLEGKEEYLDTGLGAFHTDNHSNW